MCQSVLLTGGAGFVGSNLALRLKAAYPECEVYALDNLKRRGAELNVKRFNEAGIKFIHGDVRMPSDLPSHGVELLIDCAAEPSVLAGYGGSPSYLLDTNLGGTLNLLEYARVHRSDLFFLSTSRVYPVAALNGLAYRETESRFELEDEQALVGASAAGIAENFPLEGARSLYGASKLASELMITEYADAFGLRCVVNRCGVLTGPWQMGKVDQGVIALWVARHYFGRALSYVGWGGTGKQVRDFLHVDDLWSLVDLQLRDIDRYAGGCFNAGGGRTNSLSLLEMTRLCQELTGNTVEIPAVTETRPGDVRIFITDSTRVEAISGWRPQWDARATLASIRDWIAANEALVRPIFLD